MTDTTHPDASHDTRDEFRVADGDTPVRCEYCDAPFADEELLALHRGLDHPGDLSAAEREAFETAYEEEGAELRRFRLLALGVLVVLYFGLVMTYAVVG